MRPIKPTDELGTRLPEHGRIRIGEKHGNAMRSIDVFRFTSPDESAIRQIAARYGGEPRPWSDPRAAIQGQWEVKTTSSLIEVWVPPEGLSINYELWSAAGCQRRCDGETCHIEGDETRPTPCICTAKNVMSCKPHTRLNVMLADIPFGGTWRLESKGWNAARELSMMEQMIFMLQDMFGPVRARLKIEKRSRTSGGKKSNFVVPKLELSFTLEEISGGKASIASIQPIGELKPGQERRAIVSPAEDGEVVDAEIVEEDDVRPQEWADHIQAKYVSTGDPTKDHMAIAKMLVAKYPFLGSDEACLDAIMGVVTKGTLTTYDEASLVDDVKTRFELVISMLVSNEAEIKAQGDVIRIVKRKAT